MYQGESHSLGLWKAKQLFVLSGLSLSHEKAIKDTLKDTSLISILLFLFVLTAEHIAFVNDARNMNTLFEEC